LTVTLRGASTEISGMRFVDIGSKHRAPESKKKMESITKELKINISEYGSMWVRILKEQKEILFEREFRMTAHKEM
jgi:hypothetical protein